MYLGEGLSTYINSTNVTLRLIILFVSEVARVFLSFVA